jgi:hypothetical protein
MSNSRRFRPALLVTVSRFYFSFFFRDKKYLEKFSHQSLGHLNFIEFSSSAIMSCHQILASSPENFRQIDLLKKPEK